MGGESKTKRRHEQDPAADWCGQEASNGCGARPVSWVAPFTEEEAQERPRWEDSMIQPVLWFGCALSLLNLTLQFDSCWNSVERW